MALVLVIMGSASDFDTVAPCMDTLAALGIDFEVTVSSAHRTPERTEKIIRDAEAAGVKVFICAAGMAAHLAGAVAARTLLPVIGLPIMGGAAAGMDALLSTVQMPSGFPVATMAINGSKNAAIFAAQILALEDCELQHKLATSRKIMAEEIDQGAMTIASRYHN